VRYEDNPLKEKYQRRKSDTGHHGKAMAVARREVCELVDWLLTKQEPCNWADRSCWIASLPRLAGSHRINTHACSFGLSWDPARRDGRLSCASVGKAKLGAWGEDRLSACSCGAAIRLSCGMQAVQVIGG